METTETKTGLFVAAYQIGHLDMPGAPLLTVHLSVNTPHEMVSGTGTVTQTTNPPLDLQTNLYGHFTYMTVMPQNVHILVNAVGYPVYHFLAQSLPNVQLQMVLENDWKSGTANVKYTDNDGRWHSLTDLPVKLITPAVLS